MDAEILAWAKMELEKIVVKDMFEKELLQKLSMREEIREKSSELARLKYRMRKLLETKKED